MIVSSESHSLFGSELPPLEGLPGAEPIFEYGDSDEHLPLGKGSASGQSVPQPAGLSPVFAKQYLQSVYNARVLAPADKYIPTLEAPYINLAMI